MALRLSKPELPWRISASFLLFFVAALLWVAAVAVLGSFLAARRQAENRCLARVRRAVAQVGVTDLRQGNPRLDSLVARFLSEGDVEYCCVVSCEGKILAHSSPAMVGQVYQEPAAECVDLGDVRRLWLGGGSGNGALVEYRAPLRHGNEELGSLHLAVRAPEPWGSAVPARGTLLLAALGPAICMVWGTIALRRSVQPLAAIESQFGRAAMAVDAAEVEFEEVPAGSTAAVGWNRLVQAHRRQRETTGLQQRCAAALQPVLAKQGNGVLNSLPDGIAVTDEEGRITFANLALGAICCAEEGNGGLVGKTVEELLDLPARQQEARALLAPHARSRAAVAVVHSTLGGSPRLLRVARYPSWRPDGQADSGRHVWCVRDITQQHLATQTRDQFVQTAAHELRLPLANIKAYAETISLDETVDAEKQKQFLNVINAEATRLGRLIEDLLNVSSMEAGALSASREETDVGRLMAEVIDKVKPVMDQNSLELHTALPQKWPKMHLDKDKIATSLVNVLGNAAKYSLAGGRVSLRVAAEDSQLTIVVEDTGIGISADELPKISEKFFRSKDPRVRKQPGSGLGLSFVKEVVRLHGGSFEIRSEINKGTSVKIKLPIV